MEIKTSSIQSTMKVRPKKQQENSQKPAIVNLKFGGTAPVSPSCDGREDLGDIRDDLQSMSVGLSCLSYQYSADALRVILELEGGTEFRSFTNFSSKRVRDNFSKFGMAFIKDERAWITFRGSDDAIDWDSNFRLIKNQAGVHSGFAAAWNDLSQELIEWVAEVKDKVHSFVLSGHSLGGAMAVLAADELVALGIENVEAVITIGAPRVGSVAWVDAYNNREITIGQSKSTLGEVTNQRRIDKDIVPKVGPRFLGFRHCGNIGQTAGPNAMSRFGAENVGQTYNGGATTNESAVASTLDSFVEAFRPLFGPVMIFIDAMPKARDAGLSHRNKQYRLAFGSGLCFSKAIDREESVLNTIAEVIDEDNKDRIVNTVSIPSEFRFVPAKNKTITGLVAFVVGLALLALTLFFGLFAVLIWSYVPEMRFLLLSVLVVVFISFALRTINSIKGFV